MQINERLLQASETDQCTDNATWQHQFGTAYAMPHSDYNGKMLHLNENLFSARGSHDMASVGELHRYPSNGNKLLRTAAAGAFGLSPDEVFPAAGASHALCILILRFAPVYRKLILPSPTWNYYKNCAQSLDVEIIDVPLQVKDNSYAYNVADLDASMNKEGPALLILATPNNPTGNTLGYEAINMLAMNHPDSMLIMDEAYFGFAGADHQKSATLLRTHGNIVIVRSLSKAYGLAGLRVGFALASGAMRDTIAAYFLPFGLPEYVQKIAAERLRDRHYLESVNMACTEAQNVLKAALTDIPGLTVYRSDANFCLIQVPKGMAAMLAKQLEDNGYIVKCQSDSQLRITIAQPEVMRDVARILNNEISI